MAEKLDNEFGGIFVANYRTAPIAAQQRGDFLDHFRWIERRKPFINKIDNGWFNPVARLAMGNRGGEAVAASARWIGKCVIGDIVERRPNRHTGFNGRFEKVAR